MNTSEKLSDIKIKLNRLYAEKAALKHKIEKQELETLGLTLLAKRK